jgi:hypothetical protein
MIYHETYRYETDSYTNNNNDKLKKKKKKKKKPYLAHELIEFQNVYRTVKTYNRKTKKPYLAHKLVEFQDDIVHIAAPPAKQELFRLVEHNRPVRGLHGFKALETVLGEHGKRLDKGGAFAGLVCTSELGFRVWFPQNIIFPSDCGGRNRKKNHKIGFIRQRQLSVL